MTCVYTKPACTLKGGVYIVQALIRILA